MAWYYIKSGGGATGDGGRYATEQAGGFAGFGGTGYYDNIFDAEGATTPPAHGDHFIYSDLHAFSGDWGASLVFSLGNDSGDVVPLVHKSVDDTDVTVYKVGASDASTTANDDLTLNGSHVFYGVDIATGDNLNSSGAGAQLEFNAGSITADLFGSNVDGGSIILRDTNLTIQDVTTDGLVIGAGSRFEMYGGKILARSSTLDWITNTASFANGGASIRLYGVDLADATNGFSATAVAFRTGSAGADDTIDIMVVGCKIPSGASWLDEEFTNMNQSFIAIGCGVSDETGFQIRRYGGEVTHDTTTVRTDGDTMPDGSTRVSAKLITNASTNLPTGHKPFRFELPVQNGDLSVAGATQKIRIYLTSDTALTDADVFAIAGYNDGTNNTLYNFASSGNVLSGAIFARDPFATGTTLTTDSGSTWSSGKINDYYIDIDTSGDVGMADSALAPFIQIFCTKSNVTIFFDTEVDYVA